MADWFSIRAALRTQLATVSGLPAGRYYENRPFEPTSGTAYVEEALLPAGEGANSNGMIEQRGIYQVTLVYPSGKGTKTAEELIDYILAAFPPAASVGGVLRVDRSERGRAIQDGEWFRMPVSIRFRAYSTY